VKVIGGFNDEYKEAGLQRTLGMYKGRSWTPWSEAIRVEAQILHEDQGLNSGEIARRLSAKHSVQLPTITVYFWLRKGASTFESYNLRRYRNLPTD
jgi:hypothetical protein